MIASLRQLALAGQCELLYFDESGFSPNPPLQYGWARIGQSRCVEPQSHQQRVNVLGALRHDGELIWVAQQRSTSRDDVIAFFDDLAEQSHPVPCIVVIDNAAIHKGEVMENKRQEWANHVLYLYYLPPYSHELNRNQFACHIASPQNKLEKRYDRNYAILLDAFSRSGISARNGGYHRVATAGS